MVTIELQMLGFSALLGIFQIIVSSHATSHQRGYRWTAGVREEPAPPLKGIANQMERALKNYLETFPLFASLVLANYLADRQGWLTHWGVHLYFWARLVYVPLYGVRVIRSLVWNIATLGILFLAVELLWPMQV